jgi:hypothetical protein
VRVHQCRECGYSCHRDHAAGQIVLIRGLEQVSKLRAGVLPVEQTDIVPVDVRGTEIACEVVLSGVFDLDKWRSAGRLNREVEKSALYD